MEMKRIIGIFMLMLFVVADSAQAENVTITLSKEQLASVSSAVASASSPEDAARLFAKLASQAIGQAVANSIAGAIGSVAGQSSENRAISGWEQYINGLNVRLDWPSPGLKPASNLPIYLIQSNAGGATPSSVSVGITITGTF